MDDADAHSDGTNFQPLLMCENQPSVADQVFTILVERIQTLHYPPRTKISEADVAQKMGVSRQPVREAFRRLANLGLLKIKPQSSTTVSLISEQAILRACFIRKALEIHTCRTACQTISDRGLKALSVLIDKQKCAIQNDDRDLFHELDEEFHQEICIQAGVGYVWDVIHENKVHMDRLRMLTLSGVSLRDVLQEHVVILDALSQRNGDAAASGIDKHLSQMLLRLDQMRAENHEWLED